MNVGLWLFLLSVCGANFSSDVDRNPEKFRDAYWAINGLRVYSPSEGWDDGDNHSPWEHPYNFVNEKIGRVFR